MLAVNQDNEKKSHFVYKFMIGKRTRGRDFLGFLHFLVIIV